MLQLLASVAFLTGCGVSSDSRIASGYIETGSSGLTRAAGDMARPVVATAADVGGADTLAYLIGPLDVLEVSVFKVPELSKAVQVADAGTINLPLVGEIPASGRTAQEIERDLTTRLGAKYLQKPQVTVFIKEYNSQRVTVEGAVRKPGVFPFSGRSSLLQAIAMAEGVETSRAASEVIVFRQLEDRRHAAKFDIDDIRAGRAADPKLRAGDVIIVNDSAAKIAFNNILKILPSTGAFVGLF